MSTKEEERKALEKIQKIIAGLGKDSYVATAFEGCYEIALNNIENDWACSMRQRAESAENLIEELQTKHEIVLDECKRLQETISTIESENRRLNTEELSILYNMLIQGICSNEKKQQEQEVIIINEAENPDSEQFLAAVQERKICLSNISQYNALAERIKEIL